MKIQLSILFLLYAKLFNIYGGRVKIIKHKCIEFLETIPEENYLMIYDHALDGVYNDVKATSGVVCRWIQIVQNSKLASVGDGSDETTDCRISDELSMTSFKPKPGSYVFYQANQDFDFFPAENGIFYSIDFSSKKTIGQVMAWCQADSKFRVSLPFARTEEARQVLKRIATATGTKRVYVGAWYSNFSDSPRNGFQWLNYEKESDQNSSIPSYLQGSPEGPVSFSADGRFRVESFMEKLTPVCTYNPFDFEFH